MTTSPHFLQFVLPIYNLINGMLHLAYVRCSMPIPLLLKLSLAVTQEVRVEKEGIERRIDDLAQDAAGKLNE